MRRLLFFPAVLFAAALPAQSAPVARMQAAFARADVAGAEAAARDVLAAGAPPPQQRQALLMLGNLACRVRRDAAAGRDLLTRAVQATPAAPVPGLLARSRCALSAGDRAAALADARDARRQARGAGEVRNAVSAVARATLADSSDAAALPALVAQLGSVVRDNPGDIGVAGLLILAAARAHDGPALLAGWQSYFLSLTNGASSAILAPARDSLRVVLPSWNGSDLAARRVIVSALARSRLFEAASWLARERVGMEAPLSETDARARELVAYEEFLRGARDATEDFYRRGSLGRASEGDWRDTLTALARSVWPRLDWSSGVPKFSWDAFIREAGARFGAVTTGFGRTGGFTDTHYGHAISDGQRTVTQYGHTASFRFVQLDQMMSNGFLTWFWDGTASDGGWQNDQMVTQVRPAYASDPIQSWNSRTDSMARLRQDSLIAADSAADLVRARTTPVAFFRSVGQRLTRAGELALLDSLRGAGLTGEALRARFIEQLGDETQDYSIFQHEGRHAIDRSLPGGGRLSSAELEFDAKLSQVAFAPRPELAVGTIMSASLGDATPHGTANERVMRGVLGWMESHRAEIRGLDGTAPLLPQLPLLTSAQLRAAFRSLDPLAR